MIKWWSRQKKQTDIEYLNSHIDSLVQTVPLMLKSIINMLPEGKREVFVKTLFKILTGTETIETLNKNIQEYNNFLNQNDSSKNGQTLLSIIDKKNSTQ